MLHPLFHRQTCVQVQLDFFVLVRSIETSAFSEPLALLLGCLLGSLLSCSHPSGKMLPLSLCISVGAKKWFPRALSSCAKQGMISGESGTRRLFVLSAKASL